MYFEMDDLGLENLARIRVILGREGFHPAWVQPVDMFPLTPRRESVTRIERVKGWQTEGLGLRFAATSLRWYLSVAVTKGTGA